MIDLVSPPRRFVHQQVYERLRRSIVDRLLDPGDRLPSSRAYAAQLGVARGTVELALQQLAGEGYVVARGNRGTFVSLLLPSYDDRAVRAPVAPLADSQLLARPGQLAFAVGLPALDLFPRKLWSTLAGRHARRLGMIGLGYPLASGDLRLRSALANHLLIARGIACTPDQVIITGGYQAALGLIGQVMLDKGDQAWVEDPGYRRSDQALRALGVVPVPIAVDGDGMQVAEAIRRAPEARLCVTTPANQFPLGVALSLPRRLELLDWAATRDAWIVEDDYDGEFYYRPRPLPALKSLDRRDRVFYVGTFSKTLFPALRLGYIVTPVAMAPRFDAACRDLGTGRSASDQAIVADFLTEGHFARHLRRMRSAYRARRSATVAALAAEIAPFAEVDPGVSGIHAVAWLRDGRRDGDLVCRARGVGYRPLAVSELSHRDTRQGIVVGLTNIAPAEAAMAARQFRTAVFA